MAGTGRPRGRPREYDERWLLLVEAAAGMGLLTRQEAAEMFSVTVPMMRYNTRRRYGGAFTIRFDGDTRTAVVTKGR